MAQPRKKTAPPDNAMELSAHPTLCSDGVYRWVYRVSLLKNPVILLTTFKAFAATAAIVWLLMLAINLFSEGFTLEAVRGATFILGIALAVIAGLLLIAFPLYALIMGGTYDVLFEMDDKGVTHTQVPAQRKKAAAIGALTTLAGVAARNPGVMGTGILAASRQSMRTDFSAVGAMSENRFLRVIYLREGLFHNHVYADPEDFDFVRSFIAERIRPQKRA